MSEDPLQYLPIEKWNELHKTFKTNWPRGISGDAVLESQSNLIKCGLDYGFKVYCPFGDVWNGMVAVNEKEVIIQCPRDDTEKLEDALRRTEVINWKRSLIIPFAPYHIIECVKKALINPQLDLLHSETFILDKTEKFKDISMPPKVTFGLLTPEHVALVDSTWPHRYKSSTWYFDLLISAKSGYGLFRDGKLIAWVLINESGTLLHMYTIENERNKGYAELLVKLVSNILIEETRPVFAFCLKDNFKACKLYAKAGFVKSEPVAWCYLNRSKK